MSLSFFFVFFFFLHAPLSLSFFPDIIVVVIGYNPAPCRTNEAEGELVIQVGILFGVLARNLSVRFETLDGSAIGEGIYTTQCQALCVANVV